MKLCESVYQEVKLARKEKIIEAGGGGGGVEEAGKRLLFCYMAELLPG